MTLPPRSPDLMPLDYAVFPNSKRLVEKIQPSNWDIRCTTLVNQMLSLKPDLLVRGYVGRLKKVLDAQGWHIEGK